MKKTLALLPLLALFLLTPGCRLFAPAPEPPDITQTLQNQIDEAFRAGGGEVVVPAGRYRIKGIRLRSRVTLRLQDGVEMLASRRPEDYDILRHDTLEPVPREVLSDALYIPPHKRTSFDFINIPGTRWNNAIIRLYGATDAAIIGEGKAVIDGCNSFDPLGENGFRGVHGVSAFACTNLTFEGVTFRRTGNWAYRLQHCANLAFRKLTVLAGHDGIHVRGCARVTIEDCTLHTGDDAIAGYANTDVIVRRCDLNTACSAFRFGGTRVLIEGCTAWGPGIYPIRHSLTRRQLKEGLVDDSPKGRRNMLAFFTYFCDKMVPVPEPPGQILIRNCTICDCDRLLHYNFSGNEVWQLGAPLADITFEQIRATGIKMSLCAYGDKATPTRLVLRDCSIGFAKPVPEFLRAAWLDSLELDRVWVRNASGPTIRYWGARQPVLRGQAQGIQPEVQAATKPFKTAPI